MRSTTLGTALLSVAIVFAFIGILFSNLSFTILAIAFASSQVYAYLSFVRELESTELHVDRKILDEMTFAQEPVSVTVEVLNKSMDPIRGTFEDLIPEDCTLSAGSNKATMTLPPKSILKMSYSVIPQKRGPHQFRGIRTERNDSFGLFSHERIVERESVVSVHTEKRALDIARKMAGREHLEFSGMGRNPAVVLREFEFDGIREYVPGDRARDIHWKLLPKLDRLMTKTYRKEGAVHTTIFLDCGRSMRLQTSKVAKVNHGVDISMQLSNVLINSFHPAGVATFDELSVLSKVPPGVGKHQFDRIVKMLADVPNTIVETSPEELREGPRLIGATVRPEKNDVERKGSRKEFLSSLEGLSGSAGNRRLGIGLEGGIKEVIARSLGQEQLFVVITDLISSRNAVLAGAKICQTTGHRMLVIHTYDDWYRDQSRQDPEKAIARQYQRLDESIKLEAALRGLKASYIRIGPADTTSGIVRAIRRGRA